MKYEIIDNLDKGYFRLCKRKFEGINIEIILNKYNIDFNDYYIVKGTNNFRLVNIDDITKYACVLCFHKDIYSLDYINLWFDFIKNIGNPIPYIVKPFPPEYMLDKIKVIQ